jgi:membrane protein YqaA with SNARE-associated domain
MDPASLLNDFGLHAGTFIVCLISGFVPVVNAELFLIGTVALVDSVNLWALVLMATLGQMAGKVIMYATGYGLLNLSLHKYQGRIEAWRARFEQSEGKLAAFMFGSAFIGLPPFFLIALLAGTFRMRFWTFFLAGFAGRFARFGLVVAFPAVIKHYL